MRSDEIRDEQTNLSFANNGSGYRLLCCNAFISVVESAELWNGNHYAPEEWKVSIAGKSNDLLGGIPVSFCRALRSSCAFP